MIAFTLWSIGAILWALGAFIWFGPLQKPIVGIMFAATSAAYAIAACMHYP